MGEGWLVVTKSFTYLCALPSVVVPNFFDVTISVVSGFTMYTAPYVRSGTSFPCRR